MRKFVLAAAAFGGLAAGLATANAVAAPRPLAQPITPQPITPESITPESMAPGSVTHEAFVGHQSQARPPVMQVDFYRNHHHWHHRHWEHDHWRYYN